MTKHRPALWAALVVLAHTAGAHAAGDTADKARAILDEAGVRAGLIVHVGCGDGRLTAALGANKTCLVQGLDATPDNVAEARQNVLDAGLYGKVTVNHFAGDRLPYIDNLVNLIVVSDSAGELARGEILRVLVPGGVALVGGERIEKPRPEGLDEWTHWLHGPDNNAVSHDTRVGISRNLQWIMPPRWARHHNLLPSVSAMVSAGGRLYTIIDEGAIAVKGLPDKWALVARDAQNGLLLWKRPIENWGWRTWSAIEFAGLIRFKNPGQVYRRLVAAGDVVYVTLGFDQPVVALEGTTGKTIRRYAGTENTAEILHDRGLLFLVRNEADDPRGKSVLAVRAESGEILWETKGYRGTSGHGDELQRFTDAYLTLDSDKLFFINGDDLVALDADSGKEAWRSPRPEMEKNIFGHYEFNHANLCTLVYHDGVLLLGQMFPFPDNLNARQQKEMVLRAMDAESGDTLWEFRGMTLAHFTPPDVFVNHGLVWTLRKGDVALLGLDLRTGKIKREYPVKDMLVGHHHRCYRNKATERFYLAGEEGIEYIDFNTGELDVHHWIRGVCSYGIMPANGLIYLPTHSCGCHNNAKLNGFIALTAQEVPTEPAAAEPSAAEPTPAETRLQKGLAFGQRGEPAAAPPDDWPAFKHDNRRSNHAATDVPVEASERWVQPLGGQWSPPVVAGDRVLVSSREGCRVACLDAKTGKLRWQFITEGGVDTPPTLNRGRAIFGTRGGFVYALDADDGQLIWRFRAAPVDLRLTAFGRLESPWPLNGSVLVENNRVYCVAGRSMHLNSGLYVFVLDADTGEVLQQTRLEADASTKGEVQGAVLPDVLVSDGQSIGMRNMRFNPDDVSQHTHARGGRLLAANDGGLLDPTWFNSTFWTLGNHRGQMLAFDEASVYGIKAYSKFVTKSYPHDIFTPGTGYRLFAAKKGTPLFSGPTRRNSAKPAGRKRAASASSRWEIGVAVRARALVVTDRQVWLAGVPDVVDEKDPWAAFEGREGGVLAVFSKEDGRKLGEQRLDSLPVYDGMAAAHGRLFLSTTDGGVVCFSGE